MGYIEDPAGMWFVWSSGDEMGGERSVWTDNLGPECEGTRGRLGS